MKTNRMIVYALAALTVVFGLAINNVAKADDWHRRDDERREMERHRMEELHRHPHPVVYAPAPVIVAPPPPSPGISIVFPIEIR